MLEAQLQQPQQLMEMEAPSRGNNRFKKLFTPPRNSMSSSNSSKYSHEGAAEEVEEGGDGGQDSSSKGRWQGRATPASAASTAAFRSPTTALAAPSAAGLGAGSSNSMQQQQLEGLQELSPEERELYMALNRHNAMACAWAQLHQDVCCHIMGFLEPRDIAALACTSREVAQLALSDAVWRTTYMQMFEQDPRSVRAGAAGGGKAGEGGEEEGEHHGSKVQEEKEGKEQKEEPEPELGAGAACFYDMCRDRFHIPHAGDHVEALWAGSFNLVANSVVKGYDGRAWWDATVVEASQSPEYGPVFKIHYPMWDSTTWDEWVPRARIRWPPTPDLTTEIRAGDIVEIRCQSTSGRPPWLEGVVTSVEDDKYFVGDVIVHGDKFVARNDLRLVKQRAASRSRSSACGKCIIL